MNHKEIKVLYRCKYDLVCVNEDDLSHEWNVSVTKFNVIRHTPAGYIIHYPFLKDKFVLKGNGKRFAHETIEQAIDSLIKRTTRRIEYLKSDLKNAEKNLPLAHSFKDKLTNKTNHERI
jgi:hypothetical protein